MKVRNSQLRLYGFGADLPWYATGAANPYITAAPESNTPYYLAPNTVPTPDSNYVSIDTAFDPYANTSLLDRVKGQLKALPWMKIGAVAGGAAILAGVYMAVKK